MRLRSPREAEDYRSQADLGRRGGFAGMSFDRVSRRAVRLRGRKVSGGARQGASSGQPAEVRQMGDVAGRNSKSCCDPTAINAAPGRRRSIASQSRTATRKVEHKIHAARKRAAVNAVAGITAVRFQLMQSSSRHRQLLRTKGTEVCWPRDYKSNDIQGRQPSAPGRRPRLPRLVWTDISPRHGSRNSVHVSYSFVHWVTTFVGFGYERV